MYKYDSKSGQWRGENGRFVSRFQIAQVLDETVNNLANRLSRHTGLLILDRVSVANWQLSVGTEIKDSLIQVGLFAGGGTLNKGIVEKELGDQLERLDRFGRQIANQELSVLQIRARARQYANCLKPCFYKVETEVKQKAGVKSAKRVLDNQSRNCSSCLRYAGLNYVSIDSLIPPGTNCECGYGCKCSVIYRYY